MARKGHADQLILCPVRFPDPNKFLEFGWGQGLVCGGNIMIEWTADGSGKITGIKASYYDACL
jgi:hypothetical protein